MDGVTTESTEDTGGTRRESEGGLKPMRTRGTPTGRGERTTESQVAKEA